MIGLIGLCRIKVFEKRVVGAYKKAVKIQNSANNLKKDIIRLKQKSRFYIVNSIDEINFNILEGQLSFLKVKLAKLNYSAYNLPITSGNTPKIDATNIISNKSIHKNPYDMLRILVDQIDKTAIAVDELEATINYTKLTELKDNLNNSI